MDAKSFFESVYQGWNEGHLVLWMLSKDGKSKQSVCFSSNKIVEASKEVSAHHDDGFEVFYGVGLQANQLRSPLRGEEAGVVAIPGLWADIDFSGAKGKSKKKYPTADYAYSKLRSMPLPPSVMVQTGGGVHPYWLFEEMNYLASEEERNHAKQISLRWQQYIRSRMPGKVIDSTHDLSRVLRPPGAWSHKHGIEVDIAEQYRDPNRWRRYEIGQAKEILDLAGIEAEEEKGDGKTGKSVQVSIDLKEDDQPNRQKLEALIANNAKFRRAWQYKVAKFQSQSEYDMALASHAVHVGWKDDEIAKLLITHRATHSPDTIGKVVDRKDYLERTIQKARSNSATSEAIEYFVDHSDAKEHSQGGQRNPQDKGAAESESEPLADGPTREDDLAHLSDMLKVNVAGFKQIGSHKSRYVLLLEDGQEIPIGSIDKITRSCVHVRDVLCEATGHLMPKVKAWAPVVHALMRIRTVVTAPELKYREGMLEVVRGYFGNGRGYAAKPGDSEADVVKIAAVDNQPYRIGGVVSLSSSKLLEWAQRHYGKEWTRTDIIGGLAMLGFEQRNVYFRTEPGGKSSRSYWHVEERKLEPEMP